MNKGFAYLTEPKEISRYHHAFTAEDESNMI